MPPQTPASFETISFTVSIASVVLAIVAIWLSIVFYRMSTEASRATTEAAKGIAASVDRLEKLFDKLYEDTFSMMRDTVSDMRKHIWPTESVESDKAIEEAERRADEKINQIKETVDRQIAALLERQESAEGRVEGVSADLRNLLEHAIINSRQVETEAREETIREHILRTVRILQSQQPRIVASDIVGKLTKSFPGRSVVLELERMRALGLIWTSDERIGRETEVRLSRSEERLH